MKLTKAIVLTLALAILLSSSVFAEKTVKLQFKFKPGDIDKYKLAVNIGVKTNLPIPGAADNLGINMSVIMRQKVLGVLPDGTAKVRISYDDFNMSITGVKTPETGKVPASWMTVKMDSTGEILEILEIDPALSVRGFNGVEFSQALTKFAFFGTLPKWDLEVGSKWMYPIPSFLGSTEVKMISTLDAVALPFGNYTASKITQNMEGRLDGSQHMRQNG